MDLHCSKTKKKVTEVLTEYLLREAVVQAIKEEIWGDPKTKKQLNPNSDPRQLRLDFLEDF